MSMYVCMYIYIYIYVYIYMYIFLYMTDQIFGGKSYVKYSSAVWSLTSLKIHELIIHDKYDKYWSRVIVRNFHASVSLLRCLNTRAKSHAKVFSRQFSRRKKHFTLVIFLHHFYVWTTFLSLRFEIWFYHAVNI